MYHALIRTHHITSRKKVALIKAATKRLQCYALLRYGGAPGMMYVQGDQQADVKDWVAAVHSLRYKDYQLATAPETMKQPIWLGSAGTLEEVDVVKDMAAKMEQAGLRDWWKKGMGFAKDE